MTSTLISLIMILIPFFIFPFTSLDGFTCTWLSCFYMIISSYLRSVITDHLSLIDQMWSTVPIFYSFYLGNGSLRWKIAQFLITCWGVRLSYSLWRKGGFRGLQDYRWRFIFNGIKNPIKKVLFHIFFWAIWQNLLILFLASPVYFFTNAPMEFVDYLVAFLCFVFVLIEAVADQQQWDFQQEKKRRNDPLYEGGFVQTGLWKYSRHPNFFGEMGFWWMIFFMSGSINWGVLGIFQLTFTFQKTVQLTEYFSKKKYEGYREYIASTSKLIPWPKLK